MQYKKEDISSVKKKFTLSVPAAVIDAAIDEAARNIRKSARIDGFRQGKAPLELIESRFHTEIYADAFNKIFSENLKAVLDETGYEPISGVAFEDGEMFVKGQDYEYAFSFEIMPVIDMPKYEGLDIEEEIVIATPENVQDTIDRIRRQLAEIKEPGDRLPQKGDLVTVNFSATDENGNIIDDVVGDNFQITMGEGAVLPDFEALAATLKRGEQGQGKMTFPEDYHHSGLAGTTVDLSMDVVDHKEVVLPEVDEDFARLVANKDSVDEFYTYVREIIQRSLNTDSKAAAQQKILEGFLDKLDFDLPESLVSRQLSTMTREFQMQLLQAAGADTEEKTRALDSVKENLRPQAEKIVRSQIFLLQVAKQQGLAVSDYEIDMHLRRTAQQNQQPYEQLKEQMERGGLRETISERILTVKALDYIYDAGTVTQVTVTPETKDKQAAKKPASKKEGKGEAKTAKPAAKKETGEKPKKAEAEEKAQKAKTEAKPKDETKPKEAKAKEAKAKAEKAEKPADKKTGDKKTANKKKA